MAFVAFALGDKVAPQKKQPAGLEIRKGRQDDFKVQGGVDFSQCQIDEDSGLCCVEKEETVKTLQKDPILECTHKTIEKCHYTYITQFSPAQEEVCDENFEKTCQITFKQQAFNETVKKCYKPLEKVCNGQGPEQCRTLFESACTTKYIEKQPGKFVGDTNCEKLPIEICGAGCVTNEGPEQCHDKVITSLLDVPEETCDLNPQQTCRFQTKLVPRLKPVAECTTIPKEVCNLKFTQPQEVDKPLKTKWCLDPTPAEPGEQYEESNALGAPFGSASNSVPFVAPTPPKAKPQNFAPSQQQTFQPQTPTIPASRPNVQPQQSTTFQSQQPSAQPQQSSFQPQQTAFQSQPQQSSFQPQQPAFQPQQQTFQSQPSLSSYGTNFGR